MDAKSIRLPAAVLALAFGACACSLLRDASTYRRLKEHEREFAEVEISRYDLRVDLRPDEHIAHVIARVTLRNRGARPLARVRFLLSPHVQLGSPRFGRIELEFSSRLERLADLAATAVEIRGFPPIPRGVEGTIALDYALVLEGASMEIRIDADQGYLLRESLWAPTLRTPLSSEGMDRAPCALEVALPVPLEPVGLADFEVVRESRGERIYRGASEFPFSPFFVYGAFRRAESADGGARVYALDPAASPGATESVLEALAELRAHFEGTFGPAPLSPTKLAVVRRFGGSWGAPCCILLDEGNWPRETWQEPALFQLLAHEMAHTWWGSDVSMRGRGGYLHEGLANWCAADAVRARYGDEAALRVWEEWLVRFARAERPLGKRLRDVSILDPPGYERGAHLAGAHFYRDLETRLGRERFLAMLRRFHREFASRSADFDDLETIARLEVGDELDGAFALWLDSRRGGEELFRRGRDLIESRTRYWRTREPAPAAALRARAEAVRADAFERAAAADVASHPPAERRERASSLFGGRSAMPELQVTVVDAKGDLVFHVDGLTGNVLGHLDVRGTSVYGSILADPRESGSLANFDALAGALHAARENYVAWRRLGDLAIVVEGHAWRAME